MKTSVRNIISNVLSARATSTLIDDEQPPDIEFAAELYKYELQSLQTFYSDRAICRQLGGLDLYDDHVREDATSKPSNISDDTLASTKPSIGSTSGTNAVVSTPEETADQEMDGGEMNDEDDEDDEWTDYEETDDKETAS
ncbi:hypothetical protein ACQKWADRAFT_314126 [Trichoderma austrokoningii]